MFERAYRTHGKKTQQQQIQLPLSFVPVCNEKNTNIFQNNILNQLAPQIYIRTNPISRDAPCEKLTTQQPNCFLRC